MPTEESAPNLIADLKARVIAGEAQESRFHLGLADKIDVTTTSASHPKNAGFLAESVQTALISPSQNRIALSGSVGRDPIIVVCELACLASVKTR